MFPIKKKKKAVYRPFPRLGVLGWRPTSRPAVAPAVSRSAPGPSLGSASRRSPSSAARGRAEGSIPVMESPAAGCHSCPAEPRRNRRRGGEGREGGRAGAAGSRGRPARRAAGADPARPPSATSSREPANAGSEAAPLPEGLRREAGGVPAGQPARRRAPRPRASPGSRLAFSVGPSDVCLLKQAERPATTGLQCVISRPHRRRKKGTGALPKDLQRCSLVSRRLPCIESAGYGAGQCWPGVRVTPCAKAPIRAMRDAKPQTLRPSLCDST